MNNTRDSLKSAPWTALINAINNQNLSQLTPGTTRLVGMESLTPTRTQIEIEHRRSGSPHNMAPVLERTVFPYNRLSLSEFFGNLDPINIAGLTLPITTLDIMRVLGDLNGIVFEVDDFIGETYTTFDQSQPVTVVASPNSLRWVGQLQVALVNTRLINLANTGNVVEFPLINQMPWPTTGQIVGPYYTVKHDFTQYREALLPITANSSQLSSVKLAAILKMVTGKPWVAIEGAAPHNITHAMVLGEPKFRVRYNGPCILRYTPRKDINRVMVLELNQNHCTDITGYLLLHYN